MNEKVFSLGLLLFFSLLSMVFLPVEARAVDTTYKGVTVTWEASPLSDITLASDNGGSGGFTYKSASLKPVGKNELHVKVAIAEQYIRQAQYYVSITLRDLLTQQFNITVGVQPSPNSGPLVLDTVVNASLTPWFVSAEGAYIYNAFEIDVSIDVHGQGAGPLIGLYADTLAISYNSDKKGGQADHPNTKFDRPLTCPTPPPGLGLPRIGLPIYSVNTAILNLVVEDTDYASGGLGPGIATARTWNADPSQSGIFGKGWSFAYEPTIKTACDSVLLTKGSGQALYFGATLCPSSSVTLPMSAKAPTDVFDQLTLMPGNYWIWQEKNTKYQYRFDNVTTDANGLGTYHLTSITDRNDNAVTLSYNTNGILAKVTDAAGRATTFAYNSNKLCTAMTTPDGKTAAYSYDAQGNLTQTVDLLGTVISYTYDTSNYMTSMKVGDKTTAFTYDKSGGWTHIASVTDANGNVKNYTATSAIQTAMTDAQGGKTQYSNESGLTKTITDPLANSTSWTYSQANLPTIVTDANGNKTSMQYDGRGNLTKKTGPRGNDTTYTYDANDNLLTMTDVWWSQTWAYAYDGKSNLTKMTSPTGKITTYAYDAKGQLTGLTDANGSMTTFTYDAFGNVKTMTDPLGKTTTYGYDASGLNRTSVTDANSNISQFTYDNNRRLTKVTNPDGTYRTFSYDACSMTAFTDENGHQTTLSRDKMLNITGMTDPLGALTAQGYDSNGNLTSLTDPLSHKTTYTFDLANRMTGTTDPGAKTVTMAYDGNGNITSLTDKRSKTTQFSYNVSNFLHTTKDPLNNTVTINRDSFERVSQVINARGGNVVFTYDADGRMTGKSYDGTTAASYAYDNVGNLSSVSDATGLTKYGYDARSQVTGIQYPDGKSISFTYDNVGNLSTITYPGGLILSYTYDNRNRVATMAWSGNTLTFTYDSAGNVTKEVRSNGTETAYGYDKNDLLIQIAHKKGSSVFGQMDYTRDATGNTVQETRTLPVSSHVTPESISATYNDANQISKWGPDNCTYDKDGNLTSIAGTGPLSAVYDQADVLTAITTGGITTNYTYDGLGNRTKAVRGNDTRNYHYDLEGRLLFETNQAGQVTASYLYRGERLAAMATSSGSFFYHFDKIGNTMAITDGSGAVVSAYVYDAFGNIITHSGSMYNPFTYVGAFGVMDEGNSIYFMKNRYYDGETGKFMQKDPIGFAGGIDLYAYVLNNPVNRIDPSGLIDQSDFRAYWKKRQEEESKKYIAPEDPAAYADYLTRLSITGNVFLGGFAIVSGTITVLSGGSALGLLPVFIGNFRWYIAGNQLQNYASGKKRYKPCEATVWTAILDSIDPGQLRNLVGRLFSDLTHGKVIPFPSYPGGMGSGSNWIPPDAAR